jgi:hypothetical protein
MEKIEQNTGVQGMMNEFYSGKLDFLNLYVEFFENEIFSPNQSIHL